MLPADAVNRQRRMFDIDETESVVAADDDPASIGRLALPYAMYCRAGLRLKSPMGSIGGVLNVQPSLVKFPPALLRSRLR